jgi:hypothetical protein
MEQPLDLIAHLATLHPSRQLHLDEGVIEGEAQLTSAPSQMN